ncbi:hypothetical protein IGK51_001486 [Enterococcus sp. DIV0098]
MKEPVEAVKVKATYEKSNIKEAVVQMKAEYWVWKSDFYKKLLNMDNHDKELIKKEVAVKVPKDTWVVLTANQAKGIAKNSSQ